MSYLGNISNFDYKSCDWTIFLGRLNQFFKVNSIKDENKSAVLITHLSDDSYRLVRNLVYPSNIESLSYQELVKILNEHFKPKSCSFADRAQFYGATRSPGETLGDWAARLRGLASHCDFGTALETVLRDRFVLGLGSGPERDRLFEQDAASLTFTKALEVAEQAASARQAKLLAMGEPSARDMFVKEEAIYRTWNAGGSGQGSRNGGSAGVSYTAGGGGAGKGRGRSATTINPVLRCSVCGLKNHSVEKCRYKAYRCQNCGEKGHLKKVCKVRVHSINTEEGEASDCDDCEECKVYNLRYESHEPFTITVTINDMEVSVELDSGAGISAISDSFYKQYFSRVQLNICNIKMCFYNGHKITPIGYFWADVTYNTLQKKLKLFVIKNGGPPLVGRDFMAKFNLRITIVNNNNITLDKYENEKHSIIEDYADLWSDDLGRFNKFKIKLSLNENATPKFFKPRTVPFALKKKVDAELERLTALGILIPVNFSNYATPIVPVLKDNNKVKIAGDYSLTLNKDLNIDKYPMPRIEEVFAKLGGGERYTKIDLSNAYNQFELDDESQQLTTISTTRGLFKYTRLVYGLANAPAIFQRTMETLLMGIEGVSCWLDDVCVTGPTRTIHMLRLREVLNRFRDAGLKLQREKCDFFKKSVTYLGFVIEKNGLRSCPKKVLAIINAPRPKNLLEIKRFLGVINYYRSFIPQASAILGPLHELLRSGASWHWSNRQEVAFNDIKRELASDRLLTHFDPEARLVLSVDAGPTGLGAVLEQGSEGSERPLAYASRSLTASEKNYSQVQKEAAAIIFGVKHFHQYLYGREKPFILKTDHKPLLAIFGKKNGVSVMAASRLQRYAIYLSAYNYDICYTSSEKNVVADFFSRAPIRDESLLESDVDEKVKFLNFLNETDLPILFENIKKATLEDRTLQTVTKYIRNGWPRKINCKNIQPYFNCKNDLEVEDGCILRGHRIIIPYVIRDKMLNELHKGHFGIVKTKSLARGRMWWPGIDNDIESMVRACSACSSVRAAPPRAPPAPWPLPLAPWNRIHIDYMQVGLRVYLVVVDAYSKWVECLHMRNGLCTKSLIQKLKSLFSTFGLPQVIVSDNDPKISNEDFENFCKSNGIKHLTSPIYHPCSNGQAENSVKTCKKMMKCILQNNNFLTSEEIDDRLLSFLFEYRNSIHCGTGKTPAKLMFNRDLRTRLDLILPPKGKRAGETSATVKLNNSRKFAKGQKIWVRWFVARKPVWKLGKIVNSLGNRMFEVFVYEYGLCKRHVDQILRYSDDNNSLPAIISLEQPNSPHTPLPPDLTISNDALTNVTQNDNEQSSSNVSEYETNDASVHSRVESEGVMGEREPDILANPNTDNIQSQNGISSRHLRYNLRPRKTISYKE